LSTGTSPGGHDRIAVCFGAKVEHSICHFY
jgi:hypothetical protein